MITQLLIDDYELHAPDRADRWLSTAVEGFDAPAYRENSYDRSGADGGVVADQLYGMRTIALPAEITADTPEEYAQKRRELQAICAIQRDEFGSPTPRLLTVTTLDGLTMTINGFPRKPAFGADGLTWCKFLFQFICPQPQLLGDALTTGQVARQVSTGAPFPWVFDPTIEFGVSTGGVAELVNVGTMDGYLTITLRGALTNPSIYHEQSGRVFQLNYTSGANDTVIIDMGPAKTIVLNDSSSLMYAKGDDSDWFALSVGLNTFRFSTGSTSDTGTMEVSGNVSYLGI